MSLFQFLTFFFQRTDIVVRNFASDTAAPVVKDKRGGGISGLIQRISSFLVGAGLTALGTQYYLYEEIKKSNTDMIQKQKELEKRLQSLEGKK